MMQISVFAIVVTHGRSDWMQRCINSLLASARATAQLELRICVVLNGPDPVSESILIGLEKDTTNLCTIKLDQSRSPAAARNCALKCAHGDWVLFVDDDAFVEADYFNRFIEAHARWPSQIKVIGGPNLTPPKSLRFTTALGRVLQSRMGCWTSFKRYRSLGKPVLCGQESLILCNLWIKRSVMEDSLFLEELVCCEENDLIDRLGDQGVLAAYEPDLGLFHERRSDLPSLIRQVYRYGFGRGQLLRLGRAGRSFAYFLPSLCILWSAMSLLGGALFECHALIWVELGLVGLYLLSVAVASLIAGEFFGVVLFPAIHVSYGVGMIFGFLSKKVIRTSKFLNASAETSNLNIGTSAVT